MAHLVTPNHRNITSFLRPERTEAKNSRLGPRLLATVLQDTTSGASGAARTRPRARCHSQCRMAELKLNLSRPGTSGLPWEQKTGAHFWGAGCLQKKKKLTKKQLGWVCMFSWQPPLPGWKGHKIDSLTRILQQPQVYWAWPLMGLLSLVWSVFQRVFNRPLDTENNKLTWLTTTQQVDGSQTFSKQHSVF